MGEMIPNCKYCKSENVDFEDWGIKYGDEDSLTVFKCMDCGKRFRDDMQKVN